MLGILKDLFNKKDDTTDTAEVSDEIYTPDPTKNVNFLTTDDKIASLLKKIESDSPLCSVSVEGNNEEFSTSILDVQPEKNFIIIDELFPYHGNEFLINNNKAKLSTLFNGIRLAFELKEITAGSSHGIAYYKILIPSRIYYPQRRASPRIKITSLHIPFAGTSEKTKYSVTGVTFDLSRTGISISIVNNRARVQRGDMIKNCQINLNNNTLRFDLNIRFIKKSNQPNIPLLIGGYFEGLSLTDRHKLEHYVAAIERQEIRSQKDKYPLTMLK